jgi:N-methylhydantoinase B/oxoprolinase/acetone carboxylase alpha subunit
VDLLHCLQLLPRLGRLGGVRSGKAAETRLEAISGASYLIRTKPSAVDPFGQEEGMPARPERVLKASHLDQRGSAIRRVVLADRMDQADVGERRSSSRTSFGSGQGEGDWVLAIGPTMAATPGAEGESRPRPSGEESAEARARRQSRAKVAGGRGFMAAKATVKRVAAGNRVQGASITLRRCRSTITVFHSFTFNLTSWLFFFTFFGQHDR